jgi:hypothetical protein
MVNAIERDHGSAFRFAPGTGVNFEGVCGVVSWTRRGDLTHRGGVSALGLGFRIILFHREHTATELILLDSLEQCSEIAFAEAGIALTLDDLEKNRPDHGVDKYLQQEPTPAICSPIKKNAAFS